MSSSKPFDSRAVESGLLGTCFAGHLHHFDRVDSTNTLALHAAAAGARTGVWVADEQTAGRGRGGHSWHSAPGEGLYMTALVTPRMPLLHARWLPMRAGLAVQAAVSETTGLQLDLRWPNDLLFGDRKCGGILVESASTPAPPGWPAGVGPALRYAVIGIGLNVAHTGFPPELATLATSLLLESEQVFSRELLLGAILRHLDLEVSEQRRAWEGTENAPTVAARFTAASSWVEGKRVRVGADADGSGGYTGTTRGLDLEGHLRVQDDEGQLQVVVSGNVRAARE